jgi:hypothetical protein
MTVTKMAEALLALAPWARKEEIENVLFIA